MELLIASGPQPIVIAPTDRVQEIAQNVAMIISTPQGSVPLDRDFGLDHTIIDRPMPRARALMEVEIVRQVGKYEPRVRVLRVLWDADPAAAMDGAATFRVAVDVKEAA